MERNGGLMNLCLKNEKFHTYVVAARRRSICTLSEGQCRLESGSKSGTYRQGGRRTDSNTRIHRNATAKGRMAGYLQMSIKTLLLKQAFWPKRFHTLRFQSFLTSTMAQKCTDNKENLKKNQCSSYVCCPQVPKKHNQNVEHGTQNRFKRSTAWNTKLNNFSQLRLRCEEIAPEFANNLLEPDPSTIAQGDTGVGGSMGRCRRKKRKKDTCDVDPIIYLICPFTVILLGGG